MNTRFQQSLLGAFTQSPLAARNRPGITDEKVFELLSVLQIEPVEQYWNDGTPGDPAWARSPGDGNFNRLTWTDIPRFPGSLPGAILQLAANPTNDPFPANSLHNSGFAAYLPVELFPPSVPADNAFNNIWGPADFPLDLYGQTTYPPDFTGAAISNIDARPLTALTQQGFRMVAARDPTTGGIVSANLFSNLSLQGNGQISYWYYNPAKSVQSGDREFWDNDIVSEKGRFIFKLNAVNGFIGEADLRVCNVARLVGPPGFQLPVYEFGYNFGGFGLAGVDGFGFFEFIAATNFRSLGSVSLPAKTWYETPFNPSGATLEYPGDPAEGWCGKLWFVALFESPTQWAQRTKVPIS